MSIVPEKQVSGDSAAFPHKVVDLNTKEAVLPHSKIPHADIDWALQQSPTVLRLWLESWRCDSFGTSPSKKSLQWHSLITKFQGDNFRKAKKVIEQQGLFRYRKVKDIVDGKEVTVWQCLNLHGYYSGFWSQTENPVCQTENPVCQTENPVCQTENPVCQTENPVCQTENPVLKPETQSNQATQSLQLRPDDSSTPHQLSTKVVGGVVEEPPVTQPPLEGASAPGSVEEKELSCNADLTSGIHNAPIGFPFQVGEQITLSWPGTEYDRRTGVIRKLYVESREVDVQMEGQGAVFCFSMSKVLGSTVSEQPTRSNSDHAQKRKARRSRLKNADMFGECPGFEFLVECWEDVVLRSQVKSLVAKYPQWGFNFP